MKKIALVVLLVVGLAAPQGFAATDNIAEGMGQKAVRGVVNLVTGIVELPMQIYKGYNNGFGPIENEAGSKTVGTILGIFRGFGHAFGRIGWGATELFGFWTANPADNEGVGIPFDAQYAWEMGEQYNLFNPSFEEQIKPVGHKLVRGISNGLLGILELPGQAVKGSREGEVFKGLGKGFWFWWSREIYGFADIYTCIVPNPADNPGYPLSAEYPWSELTE